MARIIGIKEPARATSAVVDRWLDIVAGAVELRRQVIELGLTRGSFDRADDTATLVVDIATADVLGYVWHVALSTTHALSPGDRRRLMRRVGRAFNENARPNIDKDSVRTPMTQEDGNQWRAAATALAERTGRAVLVPHEDEDDDES